MPLVKRALIPPTRSRIGEVSAIIGRVLVGAALLLLAFAPGGAPARLAPNLTLGPIVRVTGTDAREVDFLWLTADPNDSKRLIACGTLSDGPHVSHPGFVYTSADGGTTWRRTLLETASSWMSEAACVYGSGGRAYFTDGASDVYNGVPHHQSGHTRLFRSSDGGLTWTHVWTRPEGWIDWPYMADVPKRAGAPETLVLVGNYATLRLGEFPDKHPQAVEWHDGTSSASAAVTIAGTGWFATFPGGAVTLSDGTALFASPAIASSSPPPGERRMWSNSDNGIAIWAYSTVDHQLVLRSQVRRKFGRSFGVPSLVQDRGHGRNRGRLYAAWPEIDTDTSAIWLATSDDGGVNWMPRQLLSGPGMRRSSLCGGSAGLNRSRLAVNDKGVLALGWVENGTAAYLVQSVDGGRTFGNRILLAKVPDAGANPPQYLGSTVPFNEYAMASHLALALGKQPGRYYDIAHLGLSIRIEPKTTIREFDVVADARGVFHAIWTMPDAHSPGALFTRTISGSPGSTRSAFLAPGPVQTCDAPPERLVDFEPPSPSPAPPSNEQTEVTQSIGLEPIESSFSKSTHEVSSRVTIVNKGDAPIRGSLRIYALELHSDFGSIAASNADGTSRAVSYWNLALPPSGLEPHGRRSIQFRFQVSGYKPSARYDGDIAAMSLRAYQEDEPSSR